MNEYNFVINETKQFLYTYLQDKTINYETIYSWRQDVKFIILHSLRVHHYTLKLMDETLTHEERLKIEMAALLHDLGRASDTKKNHAKLSAKITQDWLSNNPKIASIIGDTKHLIKLIETHSDKDVNDFDICSNILKDADELDEIGILSIFMQAHKFDRQNPYYFNKILEKIKQDEIDFCLKTKNSLKTPQAKSILDQKLNFIYAFINQFEDELQGTHDYYKSE